MVRVHEINETLRHQRTSLDDSDFTDASEDEFLAAQDPNSSTQIYDDDHEYEDTASTTSVDSEGYVDRIRALKYMVPYSARMYIYSLYCKSKRIIVSVIYFSKKFAWVSITSLFLLGFPLYYEYQKEQQLKFNDLNMSFSPTASPQSS